MLETNHKKKFVVSTLSAIDLDETDREQEKPSLSVIQSEVWDGEEPIPLSFPIRCVLERTDSGVRIRNITGKTGEPIKGVAREITYAELSRDPEAVFEIPGEELFLNVYPVGQRKSVLPVLEVPSPEGIDRREFYRNSHYLVFGFLVLCLIALQFWHPAPAPKDELIPNEYAKLLLSPTLRKRQELKREEEQKPAYQVAKAFKDAEVKKSTNQLFNGKAVKDLIVKSILSATTSKQVVNNLFKGSGVSKSVGSSAISSLGSRMVAGNALGTENAPNRYAIAANGPEISGQGKALVAFAPKTMEVEEGLSREEVGKVVRDHLSEIRYCYESAMVRAPNLEGKLIVSFEILVSGGVDKAQAKQSSGDAALDACILEHLSKWKFPSPRGKESVHVSYPFIFKALGG